MPTPEAIRRFDAQLQSEWERIKDQAATAVVRAIGRRAIDLFLAATPRRTGRLQSGWMAFDVRNVSKVPLILPKARVPIRAYGQILADAYDVIDRYDAATGNVLLIRNVWGFLYPYNSKRPNISIAGDAIESEANALVDAISARLRSLR